MGGQEIFVPVHDLCELLGDWHIVIVLYRAAQAASKLMDKSWRVKYEVNICIYISELEAVLLILCPNLC